MSEHAFINRLVVSAQENPLAAALIAGGLFWMAVGNRRVVEAVRATRDAASPATDSAARRLDAEPLSRLNRSAASPTQSEKAVSAVTENVSRWKDAAKEGWSDVRDRVSDLTDPRPAVAASYGEARTMLADVLARQPLVLGVMGLGIGAALAGAFSSTAPERDLMGATSETARAELSGRASAVAENLRKGADTLKAELSDAGAEALDRLQQAGKDAVDAAREKAGV